MTSPTIDHDGIKPEVSTIAKMDSLNANVISDIERREFTYNMQISDPVWMQYWAKSCNPKHLRRFFSSDMATRNLHEAAKLGKTDVIKVLLYLQSTDVNKIDNAGQTALHYAAQEGHLDIVGMLLKEWNINANLCDGDGNMALHYVAKHGHVLIFDMLLKAQKVDVNMTNNSGKTALILAASKGNEKIVDMLLKVPNVEVTAKHHKSTPLHAAAEHGHVHIVEMLLGKVDVNSTNYSRRDDFMESPLHLATWGGHENVVDLLLKVPTVNPSLKNRLGNTPLHIAAEKGNKVIFEKLLQMPRVDLNSSNAKGMTTLHLAAKAGGVDVVQQLLATGKVDVNITENEKRTAINCATNYGHLNVVEVLLGVPNVAPCLGDDTDDTPLHYAAQLGHPDIAERLLAVPHIDVNKVNEKNETPLFLAAKFGFVSVVDLFLENPKVDLSICDHHGDSPFHIAIKGSHANIAEKFITPPRAVPIHSNKENLTVLHLCIKGGHENLVDILLKQSIVDATAKDAYGNFPIHYAAQNGNTGIIQKILNAPGVDVNSINDHLDTPLHVAIKAGHIDVVDILLQVPTMNASMQDQDGNSALHVAAKYGEEEILERLLKANGVDVNAKGEGGVTALVLAAKEGHVQVVDKLLDLQGVHNNQSVLAEYDWRIDSLQVAARNGHDTIIKSLLEHGVDVNKTPFLFGNSALFEATKYGHTKAVEVLLKAPNVDPNRGSGIGVHPPFIAAEGGQKTIVEKLIATGKIGVNVLSFGETALQGAARKGREEVVKILLNTPGIDVHIRNRHGETALFYAARANNKTILKDIYNASKVNVGSEKRIVQTQLNINDVNDKGDSIIHLAAWENLLNVMDFLLEVVHDDATSVNVNLKTSRTDEHGFIPQSALEIAIEKQHNSVVEKLTKFDSISFTHEEKGGKTILQDTFDNKETFKILRRTKEATDYIDALYKDRQASVDAANAILVGATLIASVTFASWLQPPLGYMTYYHEQFSDSLPAPPIVYPEYVAFDHHPSLQAFWVFNSLSFFSAIATVIFGARSVLPAEKLFIKQEVENLRWNLLKTSILLSFSMFFVLLAFATARVVVLPPMMKFRSNIFSTIGIGGSVCFIFLFSFGKIIYKLLSNIESSGQISKIGFFEQWGFKSWHMQNPFTKSKGSTNVSTNEDSSS